MRQGVNLTLIALLACSGMYGYMSSVDILIVLTVYNGVTALDRWTAHHRHRE